MRIKKFVLLRQIADHIGVLVATRLTPLASIVIYSRYMSVEDYGVLSVFASYVWIFVIAMSFNLHVGVGRYIYADQTDFQECLSTSLVALATIYCVATAAIIANIAFLETALGLPKEAITLLLVVVLGSIVESLLSQIAIFHQNSSLLFNVSAAKALGACGLAVLLLFALKHDKYLAVLYADAAASLLLVAYLLFRFRSSARIAFDGRHLRYIARYAIPLIPYMLSLTLLSQFDRIMIDHYFGKEDTGLYSLAYNAGVLLLMVVTAVLNVFNPTFFESLRRGDHARVRSDADALFALAVVLTAFLVLFGATVFSWIVPAKYVSSLDLIPIVAIGSLTFTIFQIWVRVIAYANKTYMISVIAVVCAIVNILLNAWLLPRFGYKVAALTTFVSYLLMSVLCVVAVNRLVRLFKVSIWMDLGYVALLVAALILLRGADIQPPFELPLKVALFAICVWHFSEYIRSILRWTPVLRPAEVSGDSRCETSRTSLR